MEEEEEAELRNPFPSPPSHYTTYTPHNLALLSVLKQRETEQPSNRTQQELLSDQSDVPEWSLKQLEKPRVDWILEEGQYNVFGDPWFIKEAIPSLAELGGEQLYPADPTVDRRPALLAILSSLLVSYSSLTASLLAPPPTASTAAVPEWQHHVEWATVMAQNIMAAANDLRPVQARGSLELMMRRQLELRREETKSLHSKCDTIEGKLARLRASAQQFASKHSLGQSFALKEMQGTVQQGLPALNPTSPLVVACEEVARWAEEVRNV